VKPQKIKRIGIFLIILGIAIWAIGKTTGMIMAFHHFSSGSEPNVDKLALYMTIAVYSQATGFCSIIAGFIISIVAKKHLKHCSEEKEAVKTA